MKYIFSLILALVSFEAFSSPAEEREEFRIPMLDRVQEMFGARFNFAANRLDSFFATERADDELGRSLVRVRSRYNMREHYPGDSDIIYRINLKLPHLEERFKFEYYQKEKKSKEASDEEQKKKAEANKVKKGWLFNSDLSTAAAIPPRLTARARLRRNFETGTVVHRFVEQLTYVTNESGFQNELSLNSDQTISENVLFRFINSVRWQISEKDFFTQSGPSMLHQLTDNDAINYGTYVYTAIDGGTFYATNYQASLDYRRNLYRQWIYLDIIPGFDFPKEFHWDINPFLILQLEIFLGH